jgi:hypothetical protein
MMFLLTPDGSEARTDDYSRGRKLSSGRGELQTAIAPRARLKAPLRSRRARRFSVAQGGVRCKLSVAEGVSLDTLKEGTDVKVAYEERDGKNIATSIEVK